jgi:hypothetical protein
MRWVSTEKYRLDGSINPMMSAGSEIPLNGGRVTKGIVRIGDTIRRPPRPNAEFIHALLNHLAAAEFTGAPHFLGVDDDGRDILTFIPGDVPRDLGWHADHTLSAAAGLIRRYHDATAGLLAAPSPFEVVCHNDLSPCNCVFAAGAPVALIDFDAAAPGSRRADLGYAAWLWLDLGNPDIAAAEQRRRLRLFLDAYDPALDVASVREAIIDRQQMLAAEGSASGEAAMARWARDCRDWTQQNL